MHEIPKAIELFLQKNGLTNTLKAFQTENRRSSSLANKNAYAPLAGLKNTKIPYDEETQNKIREHLQKTDSKYLKKFVERVKKSNTTNTDQHQYSKLSEQPFFKRLLERQRIHYEQYKQNILQSFNTPPRFLDESRFNQNQWEGQNDLGYDLFEFQSHEFPKVIKEVQAMKHYEQNAVKEVHYPQAYYAVWQQLRSTTTHNVHDKMKSKLPSGVVFDSNKKKGEGDCYPLEDRGVVLDSHDLKIIFDREKTGFEEQREMTIVINQVLAGRFQIVSLLGQAQFGKAIQVKDLTSPNQKQRYCLKIIHNNPDNSKDYFDQALDQIKLLKFIKNNCNPDEVSILNMHEYFYHRQHLMILTQLCKENLYEACKNNPHYFTLNRLQLISKQILTALATMHKLHIIHNDLKPQNILIKSYTNTQVKVIDVGSSVFFHDDLALYVQTRSYRAPEIILGCQYTEKIDIWSLGCIIAELFTGQVLFESDNKVGILAKIQGLRGPWPSWMLQTGTQVQKYFTKELILFEQVMEETGEEGKRKNRKTGFSRIYMPKLTNLQSRIQSDNKNFIDFISKCLKIDPSTRFSAKQALHHPFITELIPEN